MLSTNSANFELANAFVPDDSSASASAGPHAEYSGLENPEPESEDIEPSNGLPEAINKMIKDQRQAKLRDIIDACGIPGDDLRDDLYMHGQLHDILRKRRHWDVRHCRIENRRVIMYETGDIEPIARFLIQSCK